MSALSCNDPGNHPCTWRIDSRDVEQFLQHFAVTVGPKPLLSENTVLRFSPHQYSKQDTGSRPCIPLQDEKHQVYQGS